MNLLRGKLGPRSAALRDLKFGGFDLDLIGFEPDRLDEILRGLGSGGLSDPDSVPDVPEQPVTRPGDIWRLGAPRRLWRQHQRGGCRAGVAGAEPQLMVNDPPYGVGYDPS